MTVDRLRTTSPGATRARRVVRSLVDAVRPSSAIRRLWVWSEQGYIEPGREYVELWVYAEPPDPDADECLRRAGAGLHETYPDTNIRIHTITSRMLDGHDPDDLVRAGAEEIALEAY